jgi:perosamine synthetase
VSEKATRSPERKGSRRRLRPAPRRLGPIPYAHQSIDAADIRAVTEVLKSEWLTTGPKVKEFEDAVADYVDAETGVAVANGTAALHAAAYAAGIGPGDEVIVPAMTFAASANCVLYLGGTPVFADVLENNLLLDPGQVEEKITPRTKAIMAVDYTGQPCNYDALQAIADRHGLILIADSAHALGAEYKGRKVGTLADLTTLSFHPVKHVTTGEGGMVVTDDLELAERMRRFRNHGISVDSRTREERGTWYYEMVDLGYNYRLTDLQCALGLSQLRKLPRSLARRRAIAKRYDEALAEIPGVEPLGVSPDVLHAYHLYVVRIDFGETGMDRDTAYRMLRERGIGVNVHYIPVHLHPYYRERLGTSPGMCPVAEAAYDRILSLPMYPAMSDAQVARVSRSVAQVARALRP